MVNACFIVCCVNCESKKKKECIVVVFLYLRFKLYFLEKKLILNLDMIIGKSANLRISI
jgi:hypothetical protein